ncbi:hypothetical protein [Plantactinospora sp. B24E8]|uniref:hypothetical protein n=1 Tax=Plantactinospora sp. B24E8 TaxID=3153567 RepID=UPI00325F136D
MELLVQLLEEIRSAWGRLLGEVNAFLIRANNEVQRSILARVVEWWTDEVARTLEEIRQTLEQVRVGVDKILSMLQEAVEKSGAVGLLFERAIVYVTWLNSELSDIPEEMDGGINLAYWGGPARIAYDKKLQDQVSAVKNTHAKVKDTGKWLASVGKENIAYLAELGDRVATISGPFAAAIANSSQAAAGNAPQALFALHSLSEVIGQTVAESLQYGVNLTRRLSEVSAQVVDLHSSTADNSGLSGGNWPRVAAV